MRAGNAAGIYWDILFQEDILGEVQPTSTVRSFSNFRLCGWYCWKFQKVLTSQPVTSTDRWELSSGVGHSAIVRTSYSVANLKVLWLLEISVKALDVLQSSGTV